MLNLLLWAQTQYTTNLIFYIYTSIAVHEPIAWLEILSINRLLIKEFGLIYKFNTKHEKRSFNNLMSI